MIQNTINWKFINFWLKNVGDWGIGWDAADMTIAQGLSIPLLTVSHSKAFFLLSKKNHLKSIKDWRQTHLHLKLSSTSIFKPTITFTRQLQFEGLIRFHHWNLSFCCVTHKIITIIAFCKNTSYKISIILKVCRKLREQWKGEKGVNSPQLSFDDLVYQPVPARFQFCI